MHYEWSDHCIFYENNSLKRKNIIDEWGEYERLENNIIKIKWQKWDEYDYFKKHNYGLFFFDAMMTSTNSRNAPFPPFNEQI